MPDTPDPRYLAGIDLFNRGEFFDAHDAWEELWTDCPSADRRFYQSLIQAAPMFRFGWMLSKTSARSAGCFHCDCL